MERFSGARLFILAALMGPVSGWAMKEERPLCHTGMGDPTGMAAVPAEAPPFLSVFRVFSQTVMAKRHARLNEFLQEALGKEYVIRDGAVEYLRLDTLGPLPTAQCRITWPVSPKGSDLEQQFTAYVQAPLKDGRVDPAEITLTREPVHFVIAEGGPGELRIKQVSPDSDIKNKPVVPMGRVTPWVAEWSAGATPDAKIQTIVVFDRKWAELNTPETAKALLEEQGFEVRHTIRGNPPVFAQVWGTNAAYKRLANHPVVFLIGRNGSSEFVSDQAANQMLDMGPIRGLTLALDLLRSEKYPDTVFHYYLTILGTKHLGETPGVRLISHTGSSGPGFQIATFHFTGTKAALPGLLKQSFHWLDSQPLTDAGQADLLRQYNELPPKSKMRF